MSNTKKHIIISVTILAIAFLVYACAAKTAKDRADSQESATAETTDTSSTEDNASTEEDEDLLISEDAVADISVSDDTGSQEKKIGGYYVTYDGSYATSGTIMIDDLKINMIIYNDGNEDDVKGYFIAYPVMENVEKPTTIEQAQYILSEYIPAGTGYMSTWEETANFFIRMLSGYSTDDSAGIIQYTLVPKRTEEGNIYQVTLSASKSGTTITPISEKSFKSAMGALSEAASDSKIFTMDYDDVKESLVDIAYYETSTSDSAGDLASLKKAHRNYLEKVYGTYDLDSLTEEEIDEAYWKFSDPRGYAEYQYYENGIGELDEDGNVIVEN